MHQFTRSGLGPGTLIDTPDGPLPVEWLEPGYLVSTRDHGDEPTVWMGATTFRQADEIAENRLVRITAGAFGDGLPTADLELSPFHKVLIADPVLEDRFGAPAMFIAAKDLVGLPGISRPDDPQPVRHLHVALTHHRVLIANGVPVESLHVGKSVHSAGTPGLKLAFQGQNPQDQAPFPILSADQMRDLVALDPPARPEQTA